MITMGRLSPLSAWICNGWWYFLTWYFRMKKSYDWMPQNTQREIWMIHLKDQMQRKQSESSVKRDDCCSAGERWSICCCTVSNTALVLWSPLTFWDNMCWFLILIANFHFTLSCRVSILLEAITLDFNHLDHEISPGPHKQHQRQCKCTFVVPWWF